MTSPIEPVPQLQTAIIQTGNGTQPLTISDEVLVPALSSPHDVLVRVLAVALNPTDHKMPSHFPSHGNRVGCDFSGVVVCSGPGDGAQDPMAPGTRVCGGLFPYGRQQPDDKEPHCGAFAQFIVADSRLLIRVPAAWTDLQAAVLGGIGWTTVGLAISDPGALGLQALPSRPAASRTPVLVYGAASATGTMACQLLSCAGYAPIAVASTQSAALVSAYGATATAAYTSPSCLQDVKDAAAGGEPLRHAIDCITTRESAALCFSALHRTGGRLACLEGLPAAWRTRRAVHVKEVMAFEGLGRAMVVDEPTYSRAANQELLQLCQQWASEVQMLVDAERLKSHPVREISGGWDGVLSGLTTLQKGSVRGEKLAVQISMLG